MRCTLIAAAVFVSACQADPPPPDAWLSEYSLHGEDCPPCAPGGHDGHVCDLGPLAPDGGTRFLTALQCARQAGCGEPAPGSAFWSGGYFCPHPDFDRCRNAACRPCAYEALQRIVCRGETFVR